MDEFAALKEVGTCEQPVNIQDKKGIKRDALSNLYSFLLSLLPLICVALFRMFVHDANFFSSLISDYNIIYSIICLLCSVVFSSLLVDNKKRHSHWAILSVITITFSSMFYGFIILIDEINDFFKELSFDYEVIISDSFFCWFNIGFLILTIIFIAYKYICDLLEVK